MDPRVRGALCVCLLLLLPSVLQGQFNAPQPITPDNSGWNNPDLSLDFTDNELVVFHKDDDVYFTSSLSLFQTPVNITDNALVSENAQIQSGTLGTARVLFEQESTLPGAVGNDILMLNNNGGPFGNPQNLTFSATPESVPALIHNLSGNFDMVWQSGATGPAAEIFVRRDNNSALFVANGNAPAITDTVTHTYIGYEQSGELRLRRFDGLTLDPEEVITNLAGGNSDLSLAADGSGTIHAAWVNSGILFYSNNSGGSFATPTQLDPGPIAGAPSLDANFDDHVAVAYTIGGEVLIQEGPAGAFGTPTSVLPGLTTGSEPVLKVDSNSFIRVVYEDAGSVVIVNNVPAPVVDFSGDPLAGEILLEVAFSNLSTGVIQSYSWDFGDGNTSNAVNPTHIYDQVGSFTVTLTATGPGGAVSEIKTDYVITSAPTNTLSSPSIDVFGGQQGVVQPIYATHTEPLAGFQIVAEFDNFITPINDVTLLMTTTDSLSPEFIFCDIAPTMTGPQSHFVMAIVIDFETPFDGRTIPPGSNQVLANMVYDVPIGLSVGTTSDITFVNGTYPVGNVLNNIFSEEGGFTKLPFLIHSLVTIVTPGPAFIRGDANNNLSVDLSDAIFSLGHLFNNDPPPVCPDAADSNDDGSFNIGDAIYTLTYLFNSGEQPKYPFPALGLDPTPDGLGVCMP